MKKHLYVLTVLILSGLAFTACGGDDSDSGTPVKPVVPSSDAAWTVTVRSAVTRGLEADASKLTPVWKTTESVYVYYGESEEYIGTLNPQSDANATVATPLVGRLNALSGTTFVAGGKITLYYLQDQGYSADYSTQDGEIETIAENFNCAKAVTKIDEVDYSTHTLVINSAAFTSVEQPAVVRFEFNQALNSGDVITIKDGTATLTTVTLTAAKALNAPVYVALPAGTYTPSFTITRPGNTYYGSLGSKALAASKYYKASVSLTRYYIGQDLGNAKVVYLGPNTGVAGKTIGLALAEDDYGADYETDDYSWDEAISNMGIFNSSKPYPSNYGTTSWFLPSSAQWKTMHDGIISTGVLYSNHNDSNNDCWYWTANYGEEYQASSNTTSTGNQNKDDQRIRYAVAF
ncbi:MAG: hypothetical protein IJV38_03400 [Prevotella sp.]|nr:hypothetical protein [Prevotella sp.]